MKKILLCFILGIVISGCVKQNQEQKIIYKMIEKSNFNTVPWATIDLIDGVGISKLNLMKKEFKKGQFKSGKDFEKRMEGLLTYEIIGLIGKEYKFEVVD